jgi:glycosyltransferase involved in cell wall biosynthesis
MEENPLVSVIIVTHNRAELLTTRAIPSVLNQTYQNFELIIVADGCTDDTKDRVEKIKDPRIRFVELTHRPPLPDDLQARWRVAAAAPRNKGFEMVRGEWITQLDDDDEFTRNHIEVLLERALTGYDFVYGNILAIKPDGGQVIIGKYPPQYTQISTQSYMCSSTYKNMKFNTDPTATWEPEDWNFIRRVIEAGARVSYVNEVVSTQYLPLRDYQRLKEIEWTGERFLPWIEGAQVYYEHLHRYALAAHLVRGKKVLDLASGEGYGANMLAREAQEVTGVEIDKPTVQHARRRYTRGNLEFIEGSILDVPIKGQKKFDVIICFEALEYVAEHDKLLSEVKRLLKEDGLFIVSTANRAAHRDKADDRNPFHVKELDLDEFSSLLRRYFKHLRVFGQRVHAGSNMWDVRREESGHYMEEVVKKGDMELYFAEPGSKEPLYFVSLASDASLKPFAAISDSWLTDASNTLFTEYERRLGILNNTLEMRDTHITNLKTILQQRAAQIDSLKLQIHQIQHSTPMQLADRYQRLVDKLLGSGTHRRHCYELVLGGLKIIINEGWRSFLVRFNEWLLRNPRRGFRLLRRRLAVQFSRAVNGLLSCYQRCVPMRMKAMVPGRLKEAVKRQFLSRLAPVTVRVPKAFVGGLYEEWNKQMVSGNVVAPFEEAVFGPQLLPDWSEKSEIVRALYGKGDEILEELPAGISKMAHEALARNALRVSVIMPTWNREKVVADAVLSALNQSYPPAEVIVVDDGSEDRTCGLLEERFSTEIASGQLKILRQEHKGVSAARNAGLTSAKGDLIAYLDSDDTWHQDYLLIMAAIFAECDELATAYSAMRCHALDEQRTFIRATRYDRRTLLEQNFIGMNVFMHRRFVYLQNGGFDESLRRLVDWDLIISYTRLYPPAFVPLIGSDQYIEAKRLGNITKTVDLDENRHLVYRKHLAERVRHGLEELRLAYVLWNWPALSETFVVNEVRWLIRQGQDVKVYYKADPDPAAKLDFKVEAYRVRDAEHLAELLVAHDRTFCHAHFAYPTATLLAWPACEATGLPFTFFAHAVDIFHNENRKRNRIAEVVRSPNCKRVFTYGEHHRAFLQEQGVPGEKIGLNFQAVDLGVYEQIAPVTSPAGNAPAKGIFIGRFVEKKGMDILLEAAAILRGQPVTFELYGYGPLEEQCRQRAAELELDNVKFMGRIEHAQDMVRTFDSADFLVVPSIVAANGDTEGFPTVILEAMAAGRPVITSAVSAVPDFLRDMVEAILVEPKDSGALAAGVRRLLAMTTERRAAMKVEARRFLQERIGVDRTMQVYLDTWRNNPVDVFLVTFNTPGYDHRGEAMEIIRRVMRHTTTPYTLTIVDNNSDGEFRKMLIDAAINQPQVRLILKEKNLFCGPASNIALEYGDAPLAIYLCSNEAFISGHGWERPLVNHMREHPEEVLAGTLVHLPKYTLGRELATYPDFSKFRNQEFALQHPHRPFTHVQGGVFVIRRGALALYGRFSPAMPQGGMDVEYSYFLESLGVRLGSVPQVVSVTTKAIPGLGARVDEFTSVAHPLTLDTVRSILDEFKDTGKGICNICGELLAPPGTDGALSEQCPKCSSTAFGRTIYRRVVNDWRTHRGARAVLITPDRTLGSALGERMFRLAHAPGDVEAACAELAKAHETMDLVVIDPDHLKDDPGRLWDAALSALRPGGLLLYADGRVEAFARDPIPPPLLDAALKRRGWSVRPAFSEARLSRTLRLDWRRLFEVEASPSS